LTYDLILASALPDSELIIGPWGHGGLTNYSPQKQAKDGGRSAFPQALHTIAFFDRVCGYHPAGRCCPWHPAELADCLQISGVSAVTVVVQICGPSTGFVTCNAHCILGQHQMPCEFSCEFERA